MRSQACRPSLRRLSHFCVLVGLAVAMGCAPWYAITQQTPRPYTLSNIQLQVDLPIGWMSQTGPPIVGVYILTRQGQELQEIYIRRWPRSEIVKGTNRSVRNDMLVEEIAALSLDSRRLDEGVGGLQVVSNEPVQLDGRDCYRIDYRYRNDIGLPKRTVEYGCAVGSWIYRFEYNAPTQYYFDRNLSDFEAMTRTIRFQVPGA